MTEQHACFFPALCESDCSLGMHICSGLQTCATRWEAFVAPAMSHPHSQWHVARGAHVGVMWVQSALLTTTNAVVYCRAIITAALHSFTLWQGPPGTGKTRTLLALVEVRVSGWHMTSHPTTPSHADPHRTGLVFHSKGLQSAGVALV